MLIVYTPKDGERQEFVFRPLEMNNLDSEDVEEVGDPVWDDHDGFTRAFHQGKTKAFRAALWICMRANNPGLRFDQVQFKINEVDVFLEDEEKERMRQALKEGLLTEAEAKQAEAVLAAPEPEGKDEAGADSTDST